MALWERMLALRTPDAIKASPEEWNTHITKTVIPFLDSVSSKQIAASSSVDPFSLLTPAHDTLAYLYILSDRITTTLGKSKTITPALLPGGELWEKIAHFIPESDAIEIRYGGERYRALVELLADLAHLGRASQVPVLQYMVAAMLKLDPSSGTLTSSHLLFVRTCLEMQAYDEAVMIIDHEIHSLPGKVNVGNPCAAQNLYLSNAYITTQSKLTTSLTRDEVLEYYMLGAMAYIGLGRWSRAAYFLEHILSTPTNNTATGLMLESYKKWVLVNLRAKGKLASSPKTANAPAMRTIKQAARHYDTLAEAFAMPDGRKLAAEAHEAWNFFVEDGNSGLVNDVIHQHQRLSVSQLAKIYASVPLAKVSKQLEMPLAETEAYLSSLIAEGYLKANMEQTGQGSETVLKFSQEGSGSGQLLQESEEQMRDELIAQTNKIKSLSAHVGEADRRLSLTKEYLESTRNSRRNKDAQGGGGMYEGDMSFGGRGISEDEEDENVMADVR